MEYFWTLFNNSNPTTLPPQNSIFTSNHTWDLPTTSTAAAAAASPRADWIHHTSSSSSLYSIPDQHMTCLKLGKRNYLELEDVTPPPLLTPFTMNKKGKYSAAPPSGTVARCQVEGCEAELLNAKEYHRRHKVCEMHAKASKVVVLGIEQRFCQQCSRFHAVAEFDEAKRSCRRRLAGHNERRRKSSQQQNYHGGKLQKNSEAALSLLSPHPSARCSAAIRDLIAESRNQNQMVNRGHVTLNLMQGPESAFRLLSSEDDGNGDCSDLWNFPLGY